MWAAPRERSAVTRRRHPITDELTIPTDAATPDAPAPDAPPSTEHDDAKPANRTGGARHKKQLADAKAFAVELARLAADTRCEDVRVLDVSRVSGVCDYFVIASGTSTRQLQSVARDLEGEAHLRGHPILGGKVGSGGDSPWVALDFVDVVVHLLSPEARGYYDLDGLWGDAKEVRWKRPREKAGAADAKVAAATDE